MTATFSIVKDPDGVLDYSINWAAWLDGDTITASDWTVSGPDALLVVDSDSESTTVTTVWSTVTCMTVTCMAVPPPPNSSQPTHTY